MTGIYQGGEPFTVCGPGSTEVATERIRAWLPKVVEDFGIHTVNDAGAGDMAWISLLDWPVEYRAFDLYPKSERVTQFDITREVLPKADLILCRAVLNHLGEAVVSTLVNFAASRSSYLIATQYERGERIESTDAFQKMNLKSFLGEPIGWVGDGLDLWSNDGSDDSLSRLALWSLK